MLEILKLPPTSTSSPRETTTSPSFAIVFKTNNTAAALLFTINTSSAPVNRFIISTRWSYLEPLFPFDKLYSKFEYPKPI